jgi:hypothetical protein
MRMLFMFHVHTAPSRLSIPQRITDAKSASKNGVDFVDFFRRISQS